MKKLNILFIVFFAAGVLTEAFAEAKNAKNVQPTDGPVVTTWSKIKELFE